MGGDRQRRRRRPDKTSAAITDAAGQLGYEELRPGQEEAVRAVLEGRDVLAVMATGSGKSLVYQIAGLLIDGPTVVVSPLLALQRDQADGLRERGEVAVTLNSQVAQGRREEHLEAAAEGEAEFVFLAPEQFADPELLASLAGSGCRLLVVDEAHCISEWGHDFRPDYLRLGAVVEELGHPRVLALTATASAPVREEIVERLGMRDPLVLVRGFDRPNLSLAVRAVASEDDKLEALVERVVSESGSGIVYRATRAGTEDLAARLGEAGVRAVAYHAGLGDKQREAAQTAFMEGGATVVVSTVAFGMGVDKPDVRFVLHGEPPESLDAYHQEIGRAGRDGRPASAELFYRPEDIAGARFRSAGAALEPEQVERVAGELGRAGGPVEQADLSERTGLGGGKLTAALARLEDAGLARIEPSGAAAAVEQGIDPASAAVQAVAAQERYRELQRTRVEMLRGYAETTGCRRAYLLGYFGEPFDPPCGNCDTCLSGEAEEEAPPDEVPFAVGARVRHPEWGEGTVHRYEAGEVTVLFDAGGYRVLSLEIVRERSLLEAA